MFRGGNGRSLYEAAAQALRLLRQDAWIDPVATANYEMSSRFAVSLAGVQPEY
jgi:hypothetical protein